MKELLDQVGQLWCQMTHREVMWPVHGAYRCRVCLRSYQVPFAAEAEIPHARHSALREAQCEH